MKQQAGAAAEVAVSVGQSLTRGQVIGRGKDPGRTDVHAPVAGQVVDIGVIDTARSRDVPSVVIDSQDTATGLETTANLPIAALASRFDIEELAEIADRAGLVVAGQPVVALSRVLLEAAEVSTADLIINAVETEPPQTVRRTILAQDLETVIEAGVMMRDALAARHVWLALDRDDEELVARCVSATHRTPMRVAPLLNKYPQAASVLLVHTILGKETPCGHSPAMAGACVVDVSVLPALAAATAQGEPMTHRVVEVTGEPIARPGLYRIPVGTTFEHVLAQVGFREPVARVLDGGPLTGRAVERLDTVVTKETEAITVLGQEASQPRRPAPCVRCGWCHEDCPVGLDPQALLAAVETDDRDRIAGLRPEACIGCGLCSYVCPSQLPVTHGAVIARRIVTGGSIPTSLLQQAVYEGWHGRS